MQASPPEPGPDSSSSGLISGINSLMSQKEKIESEIASLTEILNKNGVGFAESLIDGEDYPRADIDVYNVRHARHRISCLQNDHVRVMKLIEESLHEVHARARASAQSSETSSSGEKESPSKSRTPPPAPFLKVDRVDSNSPASEAGVQPGDLVMSFGSITKENFTDLRDISSIVKYCEGQSVNVTVLRGLTKSVHHLSLVPHRWSGQGLLGCNVVVMKQR